MTRLCFFLFCWERFLSLGQERVGQQGEMTKDCCVKRCINLIAVAKRKREKEREREEDKMSINSLFVQKGLGWVRLRRNKGHQNALKKTLNENSVLVSSGLYCLSLIL
ncbi:hypothetical protein J3Q64DRAFT_1238980 [Phycomyces blakesleeanus]|uniref:Secreted protein n=1 Tax=Phycomyces blakesleeanus TaxID=4837 RepID=A0ABR3BAZ9_PHYBL